MREDEIFKTLFYTNKPPEPGLTLGIKDGDYMKILYNYMIIDQIKNFIKNARNKIYTKLDIPIRQHGEDFYNTFEINDGIFSTNAYEGKKYWVDHYESDIEIQLPFLEIIFNAIIECKNMDIMEEKIYF